MSMYGDTFGYNNITTSTTTVIKAGSGILKGIQINSSAATSTITIFDNTAASGTKIATITNTGTIPATLWFECQFKLGLTVVTAVAAQDITVIYQ